jgi:PAS domain S-box-containing protein
MNHAQLALDMIAQPILLVSRSLSVLAYNAAFKKTFAKDIKRAKVALKKLIPNDDFIAHLKKVRSGRTGILIHTSKKSFRYEVSKVGNNLLVRFETALPVYNAEGKKKGATSSLLDRPLGTAEKTKKQEQFENINERFRLATDSVSLAIWEWDIIQNTQIWDDRMYYLYGYITGEVLPSWEALLARVIPADQERIKNHLQEALEGTVDYKITFELPRPDGKPRFISCGAVVKRNEAGTPVRMVGTARDVTKQVNASVALQKSEAIYRSLVEDQPEMICRYNEAGILTFVNKAYAKIFNKAPDGLIGTSGFNFFHDEEAKIVKHYVGQVFSGQRTPEPNEKKIVLQDGHEVWHEWFDFPIRNRHGKIVEIQAIGHDITRRKELQLAQQQLELSLTETEKRFVTMADAAPVMIWLTDEDGLCTFVNKKWLDFTGKSIREEIGTLWSYDIHPADSIHVNEIFTTAFETRATFSCEYRIKRHDGEYRWLLDHGSPRYLSDGFFVGYIGSSIDITERKAASAEIERSQQKIETLINAVDGIVWEADARTFEFSFVSAQAERILGYPVEAWLNNSTFWPAHIYPEDRGKSIAFCMEQTKLNQNHQFEYRMVASDGRIVWLSDSVAVIQKNGEPDRLRGIMVDITNKKESEQIVAEALNEKSILLREVHHRIKNNLQLISSILYFKSISVKDDEIAQFLDETRQKLHSIAYVHEKLMYQPSTALINMKTYLEEVASKIYLAAFPQDMEVQLEFQVEELSLTMDKAIYCAMLMNELMVNAMRHGFEKGTMGVLGVKFGKEHEMFNLEISNTGKQLEEAPVKGFGMQLIDIFVKQLKASMEIVEEEGTTIFRICFK